LSDKHATHSGFHFRINAPELLCGAVIGRHPNPVDKEISYPKNDKADGDSENETFDIYFSRPL